MARNPQSEPPQTRRRTREKDNDEDDSTKLDELDDEIGEEEEITRCVCGQQEYPGPPSDAGKSKDGQLSSSLAEPDIQADEAGGLFIQCDICKVWQHGGCVGIMDEAASPEEYFCEECRKDLHKLMTSPRGQRYSRYLPVFDQNHSKVSRKTSVSKDSDNKSSKDKEKSSRASVESFTKRRSTMNSRAAYDEDEVLRKVLEESKSEGGAGTTDNGTRKKRSRDDSEEVKQEPKRQRTRSRSRTSSPTIESEDEAQPTKNNTNNGRQKPRGAAARSQREKELREREKEREKERAEAAGRRKGRVERRRADDLDIVDQTPVDESVIQASASESVPPDTPSTAPQPVPTHKKSGRPPQKRTGRLGRNQYTRDLPTPTNNGASPGRLNNDNSPHSPQSHVANGTGNGHESSDGTAGGKHGKTKNWRLEKMSWNDIRRPAGVMQNYITQRQVELAGEKSAVPTMQAIATVNGNSGSGKETNEEDVGDVESFRRLSTLRMMDDLSRELVHWQRMVAEQSEK